MVITSTICLQDDTDIFVRAENASIVFATPSMNPAVASSQFVKTVGLNAKPAVDAGFYFDLILRAITAVKYAL